MIDKANKFNQTFSMYQRNTFRLVFPVIALMVLVVSIQQLWVARSEAQRIYERDYAMLLRAIRTSGPSVCNLGSHLEKFAASFEHSFSSDGSEIVLQNIDVQSAIDFAEVYACHNTNEFKVFVEKGSVRIKDFSGGSP